MDNLPRRASEYRQWWSENTEAPYGHCWCGCLRKTKVAPKTVTSRLRFKGEPFRFVRGHNGLIAKYGKSCVTPLTIAEYRKWWARVTQAPYGFCHCLCGGRTEPAPVTAKTRSHLKGQPKPYITYHHARRKGLGYIEESRGYTTPCWIWQGAFVGDYGNSSGTLAHRRVYEDTCGPVPPGLELDHLCEVKACVRPDHLEPVTHAENMHRSVRSKLTVAQVRHMRRLARDTTLTRAELGRRFEVHASTVSAIVNGRTWRDVI